jgi:hypothetical protein
MRANVGHLVLESGEDGYAVSSFELLATDKDRNMFYDHYCLRRPVQLKDIVLLPGETDDVMWASFSKVHWMIRSGKICKIIAHQFCRQEKQLRLRNMTNFVR